MLKTTMQMHSRHAILATLVVTVATGCGPLATEPVPDIPQTVEYETVRIEYGDSDLIGGTSDTGTIQQALVGDPSAIAAITREVVRGTNRSIRDHFRLIDAVTIYPPTSQSGNRWVWESQIERPSNVNYTRFVIEELADNRYRYLLTGGADEASAGDLFGGEFTSFGRRDGRQEGYGRIFLDFDAVGEVDPNAEVTGGKVVIAFRSANHVRQVRTGFYEVEQGDGPPQSAIFEYTQFANGGGDFTFFSRSDFLKDGEPLEFLAIRSAWRPDLAGRAVARVSDGSLEVNEVVFRECWDSAEGVVFADSRPDIPNYDDGDAADCPKFLREFDDTPPIYRDPGSDEPDVPGVHPEEVELVE